jgi:lipoyl(octanoyl) transferase
MRQWRLIYEAPANGSHNMAVDEAIMRAVGRGEQLPTLRLYGWQTACLSLGYGQSSRSVDHDQLKERGWHMVRRPTGGKAILHTDELTYSLALPLDHPLAQGDIPTSYRAISEALMIALHSLGAEAEALPAQAVTAYTEDVCFEVPSHFEITVGGKKLIGSAQARKHNALLQHGTLPLTGEIARICDVLIYPDEDARLEAKTQVQARATTLEQCVGWEVDWATAARAVVGGFGALGYEIGEASSLSAAEALECENIEQLTYGNLEWNLRR